MFISRRGEVQTRDSLRRGGFWPCPEGGGVRNSRLDIFVGCIKIKVLALCGFLDTPIFKVKGLFNVCQTRICKFNRICKYGNDVIKSFPYLQIRKHTNPYLQILPIFGNWLNWSFCILLCQYFAIEYM